MSTPAHKTVQPTKPLKARTRSVKKAGGGPLVSSKQKPAGSSRMVGTGKPKTRKTTTRRPS